MKINKKDRHLKAAHQIIVSLGLPRAQMWCCTTPRKIGCYSSSP